MIGIVVIKWIEKKKKKQPQGMGVILRDLLEV